MSDALRSRMREGATNEPTIGELHTVTMREGRRGWRGWAGRALLVAAGVGIGWLAAVRTEALGPNAVEPAGWETAVVEERDLGASVLATGVVRPQVGAQVAVGSRASGIVRTLHVTLGDRVRAGQLLAELDPLEFEAQVNRAAALEQSTHAERAFAEGEFERVRQLAASGAATRAELSAALRLVETARAKANEASAVLDAARAQLSYTRIHAPIGGVVATVSTQEGETVAASFAAPTFVTIVDLERLEVWAYVDETDIGRIETGQRARFSVDTWPDESFEGRVVDVRPTAELRDNVVNYVTRIEILPFADRLLRPEMTATVHIDLDGRTRATSVPNGAIRRDAGGAYVLIASDDRLQRRSVQLGFRGSEFTELNAGVELGERVLMGSAPGCPAPQPGSEVRE
jgi:macrolide-specific efflux system membrane fusion protein